MAKAVTVTLAGLVAKEEASYSKWSDARYALVDAMESYSRRPGDATEETVVRALRAAVKTRREYRGVLKEVI